MKIKVLQILFLLCSCFARGQDTVFVSKHLFSTPVRNVFTVNDDLYVKTGDGLYKLEGKKWELQEMKFTKTYVFFDRGFFEADYLPNQYLYIADPISYLIPQKSITNASKADLGDRLFISAGGSLFPYW